MDVLIIYQYCTFGGVERVVLNRAQAFKTSDYNVHLSVGYLHDSGALKSFQDYISEHGLNNHLKAFLISNSTNLNYDAYDYIFIIDTPQVFGQIQNVDNVFIECHTSYIENRQYLGNIPENIQGIIVPSKSFRSLILDEFSQLPPVFVIPNPVPENFYSFDSHAEIYFVKRPITYFGRLDSWKNYDEALRIFSYFSNDPDKMFIIIGNGADDKKILKSLEKDGLLAKSLLRSGIEFDHATYLINLVKAHKGVFISPSKGESFGLSVAEFMCGGVPVLVSKIPAHEELLEDDEKFLYPLGDLQTAKKKITQIFQNWETYSVKMTEYAQKFRGHQFLKAWDEFINTNRRSED